MPACPACFGEGQLDCRDDDAMIGEHWTPAELAHAKACGMIHPVGIVQCEECESTGVVSFARLTDLMAVARAHVDQALARVLDDERR